MYFSLHYYVLFSCKTQLAKIQKESVSHVTKLQGMDCPERSVSTIIREYLKSSLDSLHETKYITDHTYSQFISRLPKIFSKCNRIESTNIPSTIEHGDFFGGNIIIHNNEPKIYDWSDSTISHPFLSIIVLLEEVKEFFSNTEAEQLLIEYLEHWTEYDTKENLYYEYCTLKTIAPSYYLSLYETFIFPSFKDNLDKKQIIESYIKKWKSRLE